jgi:hypothetical protein
MTNNKNVVEDALFQIKNLEETLQENAKGILHSTMSEEIRQLVKESLKEQEDEVENDEVDVDDQDMMADDQMAMDDDDDAAVADDDFADDDFSDEDDSDDDETIDMTGASDAEVLRVFKAMGDEDGIVVKKEGENIHLTDGDNEYMIQLGESEEDSMMEMDDEFMEGVDNETLYEIEMDDESEVEETIYEIEMDDDMEMMEMDDMEMMEMDDMEMMEMDDMEMMEMDDMEMMEMDDMEMMEMDDMEMMEMDDEDFDSVMESVKKAIKTKGVGIGKGPKFSYDKKPNMNGGFNSKRKEAFGKGTKAMGTGKAKFEYKEGENMEKGSMKKVETKEASRTYGNGSKNGSRGLRKARTNNRNYEYNPFKISESNEVNSLREKNEEYRKALDVFRTKLNEVAVFNSNLAYSTRLFTEHSTTKQEKINILRRFDNVESLKESKNLYRAIKNELGNGVSKENSINESIERTVNKSVSTGSSANLIESKTYENPQFLRMKDLMSKL